MTDWIAAASDLLFSALYLYALPPGAAAPLFTGGTAPRWRPCAGPGPSYRGRPSIWGCWPPSTTRLRTRCATTSSPAHGVRREHTPHARLVPAPPRPRPGTPVAPRPRGRGRRPPEGPATHAGLAALPLLRRAVVETLRIRPATWITVRTAVTAVRATELGGCRFSAGTDVCVSPYQYRHDPACSPIPALLDRTAARERLSRGWCVRADTPVPPSRTGTGGVGNASRPHG